MLYKKIPPTQALQPFVECYFIWESGKINQPLYVESPPNGYAAMVFHYKDSCIYSSGRAPRSFIAGQATKSYSMQVIGQIGMIGIVLKPSAFTSLFNISMNLFTDSREDLELILGNEATEIMERIIEAKSGEDRVQILENYLIEKLKNKIYNPDFIDHAVSHIIKNKGRVLFKDLVGNYTIGQRHFQRKFFEKVGVGPKQYLRLKRISYICNLIQSNKKIDWQDLIYEGGFYDQSHFIKEFNDFLGTKPSYYIKNNRELTFYLE
jgi:AraC-like DNA-binding protein